VKVLLTVCAVLLLNASWAQSNAINLDGVNDYVLTSARITNLTTADFTIEAWIKTTKLNTAVFVCEDGDGTWERGEKALYIHNTGKLNFVGHSNNLIYGSVVVNDGNWHHVAVVWDYSGSGTTGSGKIYVDGVDRTSSSTYTATYADIGTFKFGLPNYNSNVPEAPYYWLGSLDEIRIWNVARTAAQISANYATEIDPTSTGLVSYYRFNQGTASGTNTLLTTVPDLTGSNTATLTNFALSGTTSNYVEQPTSFLPVVWKSFTAQKQGSQVLLKWTTATEENSQDFIVQHSINGKQWNNLETIPAAGNSSTLRSYSATHNFPETGTVHYYRIAQRDLDQSIRYSEIRKVLLAASTASLEILGNPAKGPVIQVRWNQPNSVDAVLMDPQGRIVQKQKLRNGIQTLTIPQFVPGVYLLKTDSYQQRIVLN
jgi:hypothetical protein